MQGKPLSYAGNWWCASSRLCHRQFSLVLWVFHAPRCNIVAESVFCETVVDFACAVRDAECLCSRISLCSRCWPRRTLPYTTGTQRRTTSSRTLSRLQPSTPVRHHSVCRNSLSCSSKELLLIRDSTSPKGSPGFVTGSYE